MIKVIHTTAPDKLEHLLMHLYMLKWIKIKPEENQMTKFYVDITFFAWKVLTEYALSQMQIGTYFSEEINGVLESAHGSLKITDHTPKHLRKEWSVYTVTQNLDEPNKSPTVYFRCSCDKLEDAKAYYDTLKLDNSKTNKFVIEECYNDYDMYKTKIVYAE